MDIEGESSRRFDSTGLVADMVDDVVDMDDTLLADLGGRGGAVGEPVLGTGLVVAGAAFCDERLAGLIVDVEEKDSVDAFLARPQEEVGDEAGVIEPWTEESVSDSSSSTE